MKETKSNYCEHCGEFHDPVRDYTSQVKVGESIPDFEFEVLHKGGVKTMSLSKLRGTWAALVFYPSDFASVSATELEELAKLYPKFKMANAEILSVSCDTIFTHKAWGSASKGIKAIEYPMAADPSGKLAYAFGVLIEGGEAVFVQDEGLALRGTFIVDPLGILRSAEIHDNAVGRKGAETLRKLQAAQFVDAHKGQSCPASWEPGENAHESGAD